MLNKIIYTILGFGVAFVFFPKLSSENATQPMVSGASTVRSEQTEIVAAPEQVYNLAAPVLTAKSALAIDLNSETLLYSKNLNENLPIASLTKLMTALVVLKHANPDDIVTVDKKDTDVVGVNIGLVPGEQLTIHSLIKAMLIPSSNDAALILANHISGGSENFAVLMQHESLGMGLASSYYSNPVGWDTSGGFSNALDQIKVVKEVLKNPLLTEIVKTKEAHITSVDGKYIHKLTTTNKLLLENSEVTGLKTGFTTKALGNLIITAERDGRQIATIVLGSENREEDSRKLLDWVYQVYQW